MKRILTLMILGLFAISAVYGQSTTETFPVSDKNIKSEGYEKGYLYTVHTETGDIIVNSQYYTKIRINDEITVELSEISHVRKLISINGQNI